MNILIVSHFYPPHQGGVETAAFNMAKNLKTRFNCNVVVLSSKTPGAEKSFEIEDEIHVYRIKTINSNLFSKIIPQIASFGIGYSSLVVIKKLIKRYQIQVIHMQGRFFPLSIIAGILNLWIFKCKMFVTVQGRLFFGFSGFIENIFDHSITKMIYKFCNKIINVSQSLTNRFKNYGIPEDKLITIPNGVDFGHFSKERGNGFLRKKLGIGENQKIVLFAGRLDLQKGVRYLIRAIPLIISKYNNVKFVIIGEGQLKNKLIKLSVKLGIEKYVIFHDFFPHEKMPDIYYGADVFCLPSIHEGFPLSIAEVLAVGLPIVASKTEGIPEAVEEGVNGYLSEPKDVKYLAKSILKCLNLNKENLLRIKANNRKKAEEKYSWATITQRVFELYNK